VDAKWIDGQWRWESGQWQWQHGGWYLVPKGTRFARWEAKRRPDGQLLFAPASWRDSANREAPAPPLLALAGGGPHSIERDAGEETEDASEEESIDAPSIFDAPLYDAATLDAPILGEASIELSNGAPDR
jgi:hypothetical protein